MTYSCVRLVGVVTMMVVMVFFVFTERSLGESREQFKIQLAQLWTSLCEAVCIQRSEALFIIAFSTLTAPTILKKLRTL